MTKLTYHENHLYFGDKSVTTLAEKLGTPVFIFSEAQIRENFEALITGLKRSGVQPLIRYCAKTNNEAQILRTLASTESHVMVSHGAETELAIECGFSPDRIAYQRPVFLEDEVRSVLEKGVSLVHIYRYQDVSKIASLAGELNIQVSLSLRLAYESIKTHYHPVYIPAGRLGMGKNELIRAAKAIADAPNLALRAINFYVGTQKNAPRNFRSMIRKTAEIACKLYDLGFPLQEINAGGGVPSASMQKLNLRNILKRRKGIKELPNTTVALDSFSLQLADLYKVEWKRVGVGPLPVLALELGRSIVSNTTILVTRVHAVKGNWAFLDASANFLGESPLLFWRRVLPALLEQSHPQRFYHLSGSTLNTRDWLSLFQRLPLLHEGDHLVLGDAGAYSISRASRYAGLSPAVYMLRMDSSLELARKAEDYSDLIAAMVT
jgi:diaminopimelate decarboxylase